VVIRDVVKLCLCSKFSEVEVLPSGTRPVRGENVGVCMHGLSIKLNGQREDGDEDVGPPPPSLSMIPGGY